MSTQYPVLNNRPINLWKVVELKEELKKRKLMTKGLKEDLIKRLHEAIQMEMSDFQAEPSDGVSPEPEDVGKSLCGQSHSNNAVGDSENNAVHSANNGKVHDIVTGVDIGTNPAEIDQQKAQEETISGSDTVKVVKEAVVSEISAGTSNIMNVVSVSKSASIDEALENTKSVTDDVVLKSLQKDGVQAEVLKASLDSRGNFNEIVTTQIAFSEKTFDNDGAKMENEELKSPLVDAVVVGEAEVVEPIMESSRLVKDIEVMQTVSDDKALARSGAEYERECLNPSQMDTEYDASHSSNQVHEVNTNVGLQVKFESISTDTVSSYEMKELDDNLIADNAHLELEIVKSEIVQRSTSEGSPPNDGRLDLDDHVPYSDKGFAAETHRDFGVNNDCADGGSSAISKSDHSLFDDPIVEDVRENNSIEFDSYSNNVGNNIKLPEVPTAKDESSDNVVGTELPLENVLMYVAERSNVGGSAEEGRLQDGCSRSPDVDFSKMVEGGDEKINVDQTLDDDSLDNLDNLVEMSDVEALHIPEQVGEKIELTEVPGVKMSGTFVTAELDSSFSKLDCSPEKMDKTAASSEKRKAQDEAAVECEGPPKRQRNWNFEDPNISEKPGSGVPVSTTVVEDSLQATTLKHNLTRSDSTHSRDASKERIVPPSSKPPTNSLRIDHFLRPFTLKAVQELLAKTGNVCSFWMDNIKTHCYVTYSSVEEAIETRNAVYNLQWPPNGGRLLLAKFVDPEEVKVHIDTPKQPATAHVTTVPNGTQKQALVQPCSSTKQKDLRQHIRPQPPPPLPEKVDSPIVTLDDLFRKTRTPPQIYYLPLTEEQVAAKKAIRSKGRH